MRLLEKQGAHLFFWADLRCTLEFDDVILILKHSYTITLLN